jgi:hypothetical protein
MRVISFSYIIVNYALSSDVLVFSAAINIKGMERRANLIAENSAKTQQAQFRQSYKLARNCF